MQLCKMFSLLGSHLYARMNQRYNQIRSSALTGSLLFRLSGSGLEMQQYIDISSYRDTLGSDTVSIHI